MRPRRPEGGSQPGWLREVVAAVDQQLQVAGQGSKQDLGRAVPDEGRAGPGKAFKVDLRGRRLDPDQLRDLVLAPPGGGEQQAYRVVTASQEGDTLRVRAGEHVPDAELHLWAVVDPRFLLETLREELDGLADPGLAERFHTRRLDPPPAAMPPAGSGLEGAQRPAWAAACAPGMSVVWGPPGTGKTRVLAEALAALVRQGKRVALLSATNVAVDHALLGAWQLLGAAPGVMLRVGRPHLDEVANHRALALPLVVREEGEQLTAELERVELRLAELAADPELRRFGEAERVAGGFDRAAYGAALARRRNAEQVARLEREVEAARAAAEAAGAGAGAATAAWEAEQAAWEGIAGARAALDEAAQLERHLQELEATCRRLRGEVLRLEGEEAAARELLASRRAAPLRRRVAGYGDARRERARLRLLGEQLAAARQRAGQASQLLAAAVASDRPRIESLRRRALPVTAEEVARRQGALREAEARRDARHAAAQEARERVARLEQELAAARRAPQPAGGDEQLLERVARERVLERLEELERLRPAVQAKLDARARHERRRQQLLQALQELEHVVIERAAVVATTLAQLHAHKALRGRTFDHVLIDEVSAASPPEVVLAASRAREGVTLLGDFLQNGPVVSPKLQRSQDPAVRRWLLQDCFALLGITTPEEADANPGCVVLTLQYRFGPGITELANLVAYGGRLVWAGGAAPPPEHEIVLIDVDGLGTDLAAMRTTKPDGKRGWWPAGALLARAIAEHHARKGQAVGVVTPYTAQRDVTEALLLDANLPEGVEVGTAHRFQGREFPIVVFDLVEDGRTAGWVASGRLSQDPYERGGLRVFNVGVTRARERAYLIANLAAVEQAGLGAGGAQPPGRNRFAGGPLTALKRLLDQGKVEVVRAAELLSLRLGGGPAPPRPLRGAEEDLWAALGTLVAVEAILTEADFYPELAQRLEGAGESVWLWSPWTARRVGELAGPLEEAAARGVRVTVFTRPAHNVSSRLRPYLERLARGRARVVGIHDMHQKIVVLDGVLTFIGSLNALSYRDGTTHELMVLHRGHRFAQEILEQEQAEQLASPPTCPTCRETAYAREYHRPQAVDGQQGKPGWYWCCPGCSWRERMGGARRGGRARSGR